MIIVYYEWKLCKQSKASFTKVVHFSLSLRNIFYMRKLNSNHVQRHWRIGMIWILVKISPMKVLRQFSRFQIVAVQGLARPDFDHRDRDRDWKCLSLIDKTETETEKSKSQWRDRDRDWKCLSINDETETETENI